MITTLSRPYSKITEWSSDNIKGAFEKETRLLSFSKKDKQGYLNMIRISITGKGSGVDLFKIMEVIGKERCITELNNIFFKNCAEALTTTADD